MHLRIYIMLFVFAGWAQLCLAQGREAWKSKGDGLLKAGDYEGAVQQFLQFIDEWPYDAEVLTNAGICYYHLNNITEAENYLYQSFRAKNDPPPTAYLYLGKVNHAKLDFEIAADFYKKYLRKIGSDHPLRASVKDDIRRCATGIQVRRGDAGAAVLNLGEVVNSNADDFRPLSSPNNPDRLYFASAKKTRDADGIVDTDVFSSDLENGDWQQPQPLSHFINGSKNEVPLGFNENGKLLYFFRGDFLALGDFLVDTFKENAVERTLLFAMLDSPMEPWNGDAAPFFFNDSILLFASRRAGGYGGLDLYFSTLAKGDWTVPQNLGPTINTPYDEISPFLAHDGRTLYFSTNHPSRSIGGLDFVKSRYLDKSLQWTKPFNLGIPFNSAGDEEHIFLTPGGKRAFFASSRKEGFGKRDLYVALFESTQAEQAKLSMPVAFPFVPTFQDGIAGASETDAIAPEQLLGNLDKLLLRPMPFSPKAPYPVATARQLDLLVAILKKYPAAKLTIAVHTTKEFSGMGNALDILAKLDAYMKAAGAIQGTYSFRWAAALYPISQTDGPENMRMVAYLADTEIFPFDIEYPNIPSPVVGAVFFRNIMTKLFYQVSVPIDEEDGEDFLDNILKKYPEGMLVQSPSGQRFYTVGTYLTYASARQWTDDLAQNGYPDAAVTAWLRGWNISPDEASLYIEEFSDLQNFIKN